MSTPDRILSIRRMAALSLAISAIACGQAGQQQTGTTGGTQPAQLSPSDELLLASAKVALPPTGTRAEDLPDPQGAGAAALQQYCTTCHSLPNPAMHSATDWPAVLRRMWLRMNLLDSTYTLPVPEMGERIVLLDYLTTNALKVSENLPDKPGRQFFEQTCGRCHELPDPHQHSDQDWFVVVRRMNQHMQDILGTSLTSDDVERIVQYLASASSPGASIP